MKSSRHGWEEKVFLPLMVRALPTFAALTLLLSLPGQANAMLISAPPKTQVPAFLEGGLESQIGLLCHNDPVNCTDPFGEEGWTDYPRIAAELNFDRRAIEIVRTIQREAGEAGKAVQDAANANAIAKGDGSVAPGGLANAVRHAVGAAQLVGAVGSQKAEKILAIHEDNAKDKRDTFIDKHNNRVGLAIGATVNSNQELARAVAGAVKDGSLIIDNKDSRIPKALRDK